MPDDKIDLVLKELRELKELVRADLELDRRDIDLDAREVAVEDEIEKRAERIEEKTNIVTANLSGMHYVSLDAWKRMVWDACDQKRSKVTDTDIIYECALYGGPCKFELCPKNIERKKLA
jgi:hypothetical protein